MIKGGLKLDRLFGKRNEGAISDRTINYTEEKIYRGACRPNCMNVCYMNIHVKDGKIVRTSAADLPDNRYKRICLKGLTSVERVYDPERLKYPMKRIGKRGSGQWEPISWDEAVTTITSKWKEVQEKYGSTSLCVTSCAGNYGLLNDMRKIIYNAMGVSYVYGSSDQNTNWGFKYTTGSYAPFWQTNEPHTMVGNAKNIFIWTANPMDSLFNTWHFIQEAIEAGAKLTVIDPMFSNSAAKAHKYIPIRPATDTALAMAMAKVIIDNNWIDYTFLKNRSVAPFLVKESDGTFLRENDLAGGGTDYIVIDSTTGKPTACTSVSDPVISGSFEIEGIAVKTAFTMMQEQVDKYTLEYTEEITTIPADTIKELAQTYALGGPCTIIVGFGNDRFANGHTFPHALSILGALTGNLAKPGACISAYNAHGYINQNIANESPNGKRYTSIASSKWIETLETGEYRGKPLNIKALYLYGNPIGNYPDQNRLLKNILEMEHIVWAGFRMNDTARYADIILPAAYWFEMEDVAYPGSHVYLMYQEKAIEPMYESKPDHEMWRLFAEKLGYGQYMPSDEEYINKVLRTNPALVKRGITFERLKKEGVMRMWDEDLIYGDETKDGFLTNTGRVEFYIEKPVSLIGDPDFDPSITHLPYFEPPHEAWPVSAGGYEANELAKKYPYYFLQLHVKWRAQTSWSYVGVLNELEPEPVLWVNPVDAEAKGVKDGDIVRVFNDRGQCVMKAVYNNAMQPGVTATRRGFQRDQHYIDSSYQELTSTYTTPWANNNCFFDVLVDFEVYKGEGN